MERVPIDGPTELHGVVCGLYELLFPGDPRAIALELYDVRSDYVEAEIEFPSLGINRRKWEAWSPERRLEVILHEFAHVGEGTDELDHDPRFYERLTALAARAEAHGDEIEALFGASLDFEEVREFIVDSVNEHTVEPAIEGVEDRRDVLREEFDAAVEATDGEGRGPSRRD